MKLNHYTEIEEAEVGAPAKDVKVRWLITEEMGAPNFALRKFTVAPGGYTPKHVHPWEHETYIESGGGVVFGNGEESPIKPGDVIFVPPEEEHQFRNTGEEDLVFLCLIPHQKK